MARILSIDFGKMRCGIAATDPLQIIVTPVDTIATSELHEFLKAYFLKEEVEEVVFGWPTHKDGNPTSITADIIRLKEWCEKHYSQKKYSFMDESFSSSHAKEIILQSGANKKKRRDKSLVDRISAVIILQRYLNHI